jgi:hypothetical protein
MAEGLSPSPIRENTEPSIQDSANNTIKLKREKILEITRRDWDVGDLGEVWLGERRMYKEHYVPSPVKW